MLNSLRSVQNSWIGKIGMALIFILIIVGLSFFGFADLFRSARGTAVARVGNQDISADAFRHAYEINLQQLQQRLRRPVTSAQARQFGLDQQVLGRLVSNAVLDQAAANLGLAVSDNQIAQLITQDPTFVGQNGQFDRDRFETLLRNNGLSEQTFVRDQRGTYMRQQLIDGLVGTMRVPDAALDALHRLQAETRSIDMVVLPAASLGPIAAPEAGVLLAFFDDHKKDFAAPEYRKLIILATAPALVAKPADVADEDVRKVYEADLQDRFGAPERRTVQQIVFPTEAEAQAAADRVKAGAPFTDIAAERNVSGKDLDLGNVSKGAIFDKTIADAAFSLPAGGTSGPLKGTFGPVLVHVVGVEPGNMKPLEEVGPAIRAEIAQSPARTRDALRDLHDKIEDQRASGKPLAEAAKAVGLEVRTVDAVDATGHDPAGAALDLPDRDDLLRAAFASDVGVDNEVVQGRSGDQIWYEVASVDPAHQRPFDEVKARVESAWRSEEARRQLTAKSDDLVAKIDAGTPFEQVAAGLNNAPVKHVGDLRRAGAAGVPQTVARKAFEIPVGKSGAADGEDGSRVLFKVLDSVVPSLDADDPQTVQLRDQYRNLFAEDVLTAYMSRLEGGLNVGVNRDILNSAIGAGS